MGLDRAGKSFAGCMFCPTSIHKDCLAKEATKIWIRR